jgi:sugar phosphate isomerase/epimerase
MAPAEPLLFLSLWGQPEDLEAAIRLAGVHGFDGLEANLHHPAFTGREPTAIRGLLERAGLRLIVELVTGGDYVPALEAGPEAQLAELERLLDQARALNPLRITVITGSDAWPEQQQRRFLEGAVALAGAASAPVSFETHRSRSLFNPWAIAELLAQHPGLRLTADLSHWCCVSERLMEPELAPVRAMAGRVDHIHARVGHPQGPSVAHPFAPEAAAALEAHRRCWPLFLRCQQRRAHGAATITPEFGPDGYLPRLPFTAAPVADLLEINVAMARWIRQGALDPDAASPGTTSAS